MIYVYRGVLKFPEENRGVKKFTEVSICLQMCTKVYRGGRRESRGKEVWSVKKIDQNRSGSKTKLDQHSLVKCRTLRCNKI